jgi:hypothetical protein
MKRTRLTVLLVALFLAIVVAVAVVLLLPCRDAWTSSRRLSDALRSARSVTLVEFTRGMISGELVFTRVAGTSDDVSRLRAATNAWFAPIPPWKALCFTPHHRVEIIRVDGSQFRFEVCFLCHNFAFDKESEITLPAAWQKPLAAFFTSVGMPPRTIEEYQALAEKHPDYHLLDKQLRDIDPQIEKGKKQP